jgi:succinate dehydrogenase / fumarate reductase flavoprotein subunit
MKSQTPKIIVVGAGISGMAAAISAIESGAHVTLISRVIPVRSGSACIREGINAAIDPADSDGVSAHAADTLRASCFLAREDDVKRMCGAAPSIVDILCSMGVLFDRTKGEGRVRQGLSCGATKNRTLYSGRATGARLLSALTGQILRHESHGRVDPLFGWEFLSLVLDENGRCKGAVAQNLKNMELRAVAADAVILCSGGYAGIFGHHCASALNDGFAAMTCCVQGARFANPEFVQVHPFAVPSSDKCCAVVDAALTEGGRISISRDGRPWYFLEEWYPQSKGIVLRAEATRALLRAAKEAGSKEGAAVTLDLSQVDPAIIEDRLASVIDVCDGICDVDFSSPVIEVMPAVSYTMGGLFVNSDHATTIEGLFAAGSCACAYHGALVLGGNELLASVHGGLAAGKSSVDYASALTPAADEAPASVLKKAIDREEDAIARISAQDGKENAHAIALELGRTLTESASIEKDNEDLARASGKITELDERMNKASLLDRAEWANSEVFFMRSVRNRLRLARMIVEASIARNESRGSHYKPKFPNQDPKWQVMTQVSWSHDAPMLDHSEKMPTPHLLEQEQK